MNYRVIKKSVFKMILKINNLKKNNDKISSLHRIYRKEDDFFYDESKNEYLDSFSFFLD